MLIAGAASGKEPRKTMPYRLIYDDPGTEGWIDGPSVDDADGHPIPVTAKSFSRRWFNDVLAQRVGAPEALAVLLEGDKCDRRVVGHHLFRLTTARAGPVSREDVERAATAVKRAAMAVRGIEISSLARTVDPDRRLVGLANVLRGYAARLQRVAPTATRRDQPDRDLALAGLVRYVEERTSLRHDAEVAVLVDATIEHERDDDGPTGDLAYTTETHTKWRQRHQGLLKAKSLPHGPAPQTVADERTAEARRLRKERHRHRRLTTALIAARRLFPASFPKTGGDLG